MKLKLARHLWGVDLTHGLPHYAAHWREVGYEAIEVSIRKVPNRDLFFDFLRQNNLQWIPQIFTNEFRPGGSVREHLHSLRSQLEDSIDCEPLFFNAHSGYDNWSPAEAEDFFGQALVLEKEIGIVISHETHRMRCLGTPWQTRYLLKRFPELRITCDFSHWVCVCERLLEDLSETIDLAARCCHHIHARVGFEEGPQVSDPSTPENAAYLKAHEIWWSKIWQSQRAHGMQQTTLTPEFGPPPYLHTLPYSNVPVINLENVCDWMAIRQRQLFNSLTENLVS